MERRTCKFCFRSFSNGRALGGHMRSHFAPATVAAVKPLLSDDISISSTSGEAEAAIQARDSETEFPPPSSFPAGIHRLRSKRHRRSPPASPELLSSVSDVALCLMMLSRDVWEGDKGGAEEGQRIAGRFQCRSCKRVFRSYQALGGHRANHKKSRCCTASPSPEPNDGGCGGDDGKAVPHECPFCFRVFTSGQALGGHKRSHLPPSTVTLTRTSPPLPSSPPAVHGAPELCKALFDLNLPAPPDHEEAELSAVSDHESAVSHRPPLKR